MQSIESSDRSLLLVFGDAISAEVHRDVIRLTPLVRALEGVTNVHPAYASILIDFDPLTSSHLQLQQAAEELYARAAAIALPPPRTVKIPVVYGGDDGPDLEEVASLTGHSREEVIAIHSGADYTVYFLGFSPGFPYLGGLPGTIAAPRLETPRRKVPAGSVAIGGNQTGVYPMASPGGWRIIGRTSVRLFRPEADPPTLLKMGDHVKFVPVESEAI